MDKEYLTVKDFAAAAGVSRQAIYQACDKWLSEFVKVIDGKKHIDKSALQLYPVNKIEQSVDRNSKGIEANHTSTVRVSDLPTMDEIAEMKEDLYYEQEMIIMELKERIAGLEKDKERLYDLLEEKEKSLQQAQALHLNTQGIPLLEEKEKSEGEKSRRGIFERFKRKK